MRIQSYTRRGRKSFLARLRAITEESVVCRSRRLGARTPVLCRFTRLTRCRLPGSVTCLLALCCMLSLLCPACQVLTYSGPNGERLSRSSLGVNTSISSLAVETGTNGLRRVELHGYSNDSSQAVSKVIEAAVRAAIQSPK